MHQRGLVGPAALVRARLLHCLSPPPEPGRYSPQRSLFFKPDLMQICVPSDEDIATLRSSLPKRGPASKLSVTQLPFTGPELPPRGVRLLLVTVFCEQ
jgi:hypothetical protein